MSVQSLYQKAILFATGQHHAKDQKLPGTELPYLVHLSNVAMEILIAGAATENFDLEFAVQLAMLHDTLEDTDTTYEELKSEFGSEVADGVAALTKNESLPKSEKMNDSLNRIRLLRKEVWAVKLADRITNMQKPPEYWSREKRVDYQKEALHLLEKLSGGNPYLELRLKEQIRNYSEYLV
ncbi:MAG: bifunctional (p)ppGpp synthetase/guanosine-3',5'-bis(diphosphate) 3'-pyrophosphohydrolase [Sphingobacteriales bacterium]|nr:MAG: bifunctional (p)ppGpp synthetase/guanosine-3',5'-bis(diphosphate) 3'-pyrophosphohydrolase [Sphingobacteriales bacterium]